MVRYQLRFLDPTGEMVGGGFLNDKDELNKFLEKANLSKTKDVSWNIEVQIIRVEHVIDDGVKVTADSKIERRYGLSGQIEATLKDLGKPFFVNPYPKNLIAKLKQRVLTSALSHVTLHNPK